MGSVQIAQNEELFCGERRAKNEISAATLSHHLNVLSDLGLITSRKEGLNVDYRGFKKSSDNISVIWRISDTNPGHEASFNSSPSL